MCLFENKKIIIYIWYWSKGKYDQLTLFPKLMKHLYYRLIVVVFIVLSGSKVSAQTAAEAMTHPVINQYYTPEQLLYLEQNDTAKLASIIYYFTQSFIVEPIQCSDCLPFDSLNFDISKSEYLRLDTTTYIRVFDKYGFKLILLPISEMPYYYDIQHVPEIDPGDLNESPH
ncbi:hypothetical protein BH09BAC5_BH09BAC5_03730 [soil metagenome]